jgi:crotonobetainyl-CoA:carnitine CoA-transferase CaiB-like acyl-CoA transferase
MMSAQGGDDEPVFLTAAVNDVTAAAASVLGICVALFARLRGRGGQQAATTLAGISLFMQSGELVRFAGRPASPRGGRDFAGPTPLDRMYQVADGYVRIQAADLAQLNRAGFAVDPSLPDDELAAQIAGILAGMTAGEAVAALYAAGVPAARARSYGELVQDQLLRDSGFLEEHVRKDGGLYYLPGRFAQFSQTQQTRVLVAPGIGEHTRAVLSEAGYAAEDIDKLVSLGIVKEGEPFHFNGRISYR